MINDAVGHERAAALRADGVILAFWRSG